MKITDENNGHNSGKFEPLLKRWTFIDYAFIHYCSNRYVFRFPFVFHDFEPESRESRNVYRLKCSK